MLSLSPWQPCFVAQGAGAGTERPSSAAAASLWHTRCVDRAPTQPGTARQGLPCQAILAPLSRRRACQSDAGAAGWERSGAALVGAPAAGTRRVAKTQHLNQHTCPAASLTCRVGARPPLPSQLNEQRVVALSPGRPALLAMPGPNPSNDNSSAVVVFQVGSVLTP